MRAELFSHRSLSPTEPLEPRTLECHDCGLVQRLAASQRSLLITCRRCLSPLLRTWGHSRSAALAFSLATLLLFIPAVLEPFLTTSALGATRTSVLPSSVLFLWNEGWPLLASIVASFLLVFPLLRFCALTAVLATLRRAGRPAWLGPVFRFANALETWAMLDVFLLGFAVAYARLHSSISVTLGMGAVCFIAAALCSLFTRACLDQPNVWETISRDLTPVDAAEAVTCARCSQRILHTARDRRCPRCRAPLRTRRLDSVALPLALLVAAAILYLPANLYPIATIPIDITPTSYTVLGGIKDLAASHYIGLAVLVFCASLAIPILKMAGIAWCVVSVLYRSDKRLVAKTRVHRWLDEIGRWSMVDPFTIACFVPVVHFNAMIDSRAEPAALPFAAVVILTTLSVKSFDPRRLWDARERSA